MLSRKVPAETFSTHGVAAFGAAYSFSGRSRIALGPRPASQGKLSVLNCSDRAKENYGE